MPGKETSLLFPQSSSLFPPDLAFLSFFTVIFTVIYCETFGFLTAVKSQIFSNSNFLLQSAKNMANAVYTSSSGGSGCKVHPENENKCHPDSDVSCLLKSSGRFRWCCEAVVGATVLTQTSQTKPEGMSHPWPSQPNSIISLTFGTVLLF